MLIIIYVAINIHLFIYLFILFINRVIVPARQAT